MEPAGYSIPEAIVYTYIANKRKEEYLCVINQIQTSLIPSPRELQWEVKEVKKLKLQSLFLWFHSI